MKAPAAIMGDYTDLVFRKTRKVAIISIEIPIEQSAAFVAAFGTPSQSTGVPVAIARIDPNAAREAPKPPYGVSPKLHAEVSERERRKWDQLRPAQQAAMRCKEKAFQKFVETDNDDDAAYTVRDFCGVKSRSDILEGTAAARKWADLDREYQAWLRV